MFKEGTRDYIVTNKQSYASWPSKKTGYHFIFTKTLLQEAIKFHIATFSQLEIS